MTFADFFTRWSAATGGERANYQLFLTELCELLELPKPEPAQKEAADNAYGFERRVDLVAPDGAVTPGFIDLYRRGCFVCEAKQSGLDLATGGWDKAMVRARGQAQRYARALPAAEGRPPLLLITDVGRSLELYAEFTRSGAEYTPFPDARSHRILLADLEREEIRARLRAAWLDPLSLDPTRASAKVTREIAARLAELAKSLEAAGHPPQATAGFLMRCLFSMFAEDVGLLPAETFTGLLRDLREAPDKLQAMLEQLWRTMDQGGLWSRTADFLLRFNGGLFRDNQAPLLSRDQVDLVRDAARADWRQVEPSIFGTLLERALEPAERHKLGAHYTPRAYVERLVLPTLVEPLRADWRDAQAAALSLDQQGRRPEAIAIVAEFQRRLCRVRVLDPACGSGNFLYVALEHLKRLEGEVLTLLGDLGATGLLELEHVTVDPHQFLGLEINPRAAAIAELVLWIGYLQWHFRVHGHVTPPEPVLRDFHNIQCRDALLDYDRVEPALDEDGRPLTRWDGVSTKPHPVTGRPVPDESARRVVERYVNPRKAVWPEADFVVGNPPFIGTKLIRSVLGDGYAAALRKTWAEIPASADLVMYWWHHAAELVRSGRIQRFGFITTNSIRQEFNRRIVEAQLTAEPPLGLVFAIPDHPWVDSADGAAVRIAMTTGSLEFASSKLALVIAEESGSFDETKVSLKLFPGNINSDLSIGTNTTRMSSLQSNLLISQRGVELGGAGFMIASNEINTIEVDAPIKRFRNNKDIMDIPREIFVIDLFGYSIDDVRKRWPKTYQRLLQIVKPDRDQNRSATLREFWWLHRRLREDLRKALVGIDKFIVTGVTSKHRVFTFVDSECLPDDALIAIALESYCMLAVLSSRMHAIWSLKSGGLLGETPRYIKSNCFEPFPAPITSPAVERRLNELGEQLDAHRKARQAAVPGLTLTGMYNVLEAQRQALRQGRPLTAKEKEIHEAGLVSVLASLHDDIDRAVLAAYGWEDLAPALVGKPGGTLPLADPDPEQAAAQEELLARLVALNTQRAAEEKQGLVRWLRPDFQCRDKGAPPAGGQARLPGTDAADLAEEAPGAGAAAALPVAAKLPWPKDWVEQIKAVRAQREAGLRDAAEIAARFKHKPLKAVELALRALDVLGQ